MATQNSSMNALTKAMLDASNKGKMVNLTTKTGTEDIPKKENKKQGIVKSLVEGLKFAFLDKSSRGRPMKGIPTKIPDLSVYNPNITYSLYERPTLTREELNRYSRGNYGKSEQSKQGTYTVGGYTQYPTMEEQLAAYSNGVGSSPNLKPSPKPLTNAQKLEIARKQKAGIPLTSATPEAISYYNSLKQITSSTVQPGSQTEFKGIPGNTVTGQGANAPIVETILDKGVPKLTNLAQQEIARKAKAGIPLTNPTPLAQAYYDSVKQSLQSTPVVKEGIVVQEKPITEEKTVTDNQIAPSDTSTMKETPSSKAYSDLIEAQKAKTISELDTIKQQALGKIGQQQAAINPQFEAQRTQAATQSMQQARNFAEYMAARGQTNAGITAQAELSRGSGLTRQLGEIGQQQQAAQQDVAMRRSVIEQDYLNKIANATTEAEIQKAAKEYQDLVKNEERTYQESRQTLQREQELSDIASSREFARQQSAAQRQFAREQQQAEQQAEQQSDIDKQEQQQVEQQQNSFVNSAIDLVRQSKIQVITPAIPEIRNPFNGFIMSEAIPEKTELKTVSPSEILDNIIQNAEEMRSTYGDKNYEKLLKEARMMANKQLGIQGFN